MLSLLLVIAFMLLIIGACLAKHYIHKSSTDMRALKIINFGKKKYLKVFHNNCLSHEENNFEFPLLEKKKIQIR